jgi:hypothetical protein
MVRFPIAKNMRKLTNAKNATLDTRFKIMEIVRRVRVREVPGSWLKKGPRRYSVMTSMLIPMSVDSALLITSLLKTKLFQLMKPGSPTVRRSMEYSFDVKSVLIITT